TMVNALARSKEPQANLGEINLVRIPIFNGENQNPVEWLSPRVTTFVPPATRSPVAQIATLLQEIVSTVKSNSNDSYRPKGTQSTTSQSQALVDFENSGA
ncbi:4314_t:CDS:2, partial [Racocetra fulgida]